MQNQNKKPYAAPSLSIEELSKGLYESNLKLDDINKRQSEFFSNISHDLRSPIAAIKTAIEYLQSTPDIDPSETEKLYKLIYKKVASLDYMINEVFFLTKLDTNSDIVKPVLIPCGNYLEDFFFTAQADSKFKNIRLRLDVPLDFNHMINIDPNYFERVLNNLFDNAFRYLESDGCITLKATTNNQADKVFISVIDNGSGIDPTNLARIFERSFTGDTSRTPDDKTGAGLGLSICKRIIEIHNGTISCDSKTGSNHGTCFTITLPIFKS